MWNFRKSKGTALVAAVLSAAIISILGLSTTKIFSSALNTLSFTKVVTHAEQYAKAQAGLVRAQSYADLASVDKTEISGTNFKYEINVGEESDYNDDIKQKNVVVSIYNKSESSPIYTLNVPRFSKEPSSGGTSGITVVETWHEGTEWYRVWSDGWIEQGGFINNNTTGQHAGSVKFKKAFTSVNLTLTHGGTGYPNYKTQGYSFNDITKTGFSFTSGLNGSGRYYGFYYYACGY